MPAMPGSYATVGATGDASRGIPRCGAGAAIPGGSGGTGGTEAAAVAAAGIGGAAAQRESPGRDPPRAIGGAADAHCPAIKWSSCGKTRGWRVVDVVVLGSLEVVLMLVQFKIVKTVAIVMQSSMDCRDSDIFRSFAERNSSVAPGEFELGRTCGSSAEAAA